MSQSKGKNEELTFDYIVIGTGPSGAVIAKTFSDDKKSSVLVLEAGGNNDRDQPIRDSTFALELEEHLSLNTFGKGRAFLRKSWTRDLLNGPRVDY